MENTRTCRKCKKTLPLDGFYGNRTACKKCHIAESSANRRKLPAMRDRTCDKCKVHKKADQFRTKRGYCLECLKGPEDGLHRCHGCKEFKSIDNFLALSRYARCADCRRRHTTDQIGRWRPAKKISLRKPTCTKCRKIRAYPHFPYNPATRKYSTVCNGCRYQEQVWVCATCETEKPRDNYSIHHWQHRKKVAPTCLTCRPVRLYMTEYHDQEFAFARDIAGMSHNDAVKWMHKSFGGLLDSYYSHYGWPDNPKPHEPYRLAPLEEPERTLIEYVALDGRNMEGTVWCEGPKDKTVWVIRPDHSCAVVNPTKGIEVEYTQPTYVQPIPEEVLQTAKDVLEGYARAKQDLKGLGHIKPIGQDYMVAATLLAHHRQHQRSRQPFLDGHSTRASVSTKRLRELTKEDIEVNP